MFLDLSGYSLPAPGSTGDIYAGDGWFYTGPVIGQYQVIPEPATAAAIFGLVAVAGIGIHRFRRK